MKLISSEDIMKSAGPLFDGFSYHFYGAVSRRCGGSLTADKALAPDWLDSSEKVEEFYAQMRDKYAPGKPIWLTETAEAACGGDPLAAQFIDTFRYASQLGSLAQKGVRAVMHNTLAASDYGLLDEDTLQPRPDYWVALLWKRTMGNVVLDPGVPKDDSVRIYAQCAKEEKGSVALVALNTDTQQGHELVLPLSATRFTLTSPNLTSGEALLNGVALKAEPDGSIAPLKSEKVSAGTVQLPPVSVTFLTLASAHNKSCE
jgi:hypothetical protein